MKEAINLTTSEKRQYFGYLLLLFAIISLLLGWLLFAGVRNPFKMLNKTDMAFLQQKQIFEKKQDKALVLYDSTVSKIDMYRNSPSNVLEADIKADIRVINELYDTSAHSDSRNICFQQMGAFLEMYFTDAMNLHKTLANTGLFQKQLADCRMGLDKSGDQIRAAVPTSR